MTGETKSLVLELLRGIGADATAFRCDMEERFTAVEVRLGAIDVKDQNTRIPALEGSSA